MGLVDDYKQQIDDAKQKKKDEQKEREEANKKAMLDMGFEFGGDEIPESLDGNERVIKVNLPDTKRADTNWRIGNGEGCWTYVRHPEDMDKYYRGEGTFEVILLNASFYYMGFLKWGAVIQVEGRGTNNRPVLVRSWINAILKSNGQEGV